MTDNTRVLSWLDKVTDEAPSDTSLQVPQDSFTNVSGLAAAYDLRFRPPPPAKSTIELLVDSYAARVAESQAYLPELKARADRWNAYEERMTQTVNYDNRYLCEDLFAKAEPSNVSVRSEYDFIEASLQKDMSTQIAGFKEEEKELRRSIADEWKLLAADSRRLKDLVECERQLDACLSALASSNNNGEHDALKNLEAMRPTLEKLGFKDELDKTFTKL